jgi:nitrile hydratase accessory protein
VSDEGPAELLDVGGPAAPPRRNGELVFEAPWESRLFGLTLSLHRAGLFEWEEFRQRLIGEIAAWERAAGPGAAWSYYERWQAAFEALLAAKGLLAAPELDARARAFAALPPGHDHASPTPASAPRGATRR